MFNHQRLRCYVLSIDLAKRVPDIIRTWRGYADLVDQLKRAVTSIALNISEGNGRTAPKERKHFFSIARGSATEVASITEVAHAMNMLSEDDYQFFQDNLLQIVKILYKLS